MTQFTGLFDTVHFGVNAEEETNRTEGLNLFDFNTKPVSELVAPLDEYVRYLYVQLKEHKEEVAGEIIKRLGELYAAAYNHPTATLVSKKA